MNITGGGRSLILIQAPIADCCFMDGIYTGDGEEIISYDIDKVRTANIRTQDLARQ
jgi:hypothetical protein